ncbi:hypothetical protein [Bacillus wiedmannii]|uniref:DUF2922 domain-containing protein n=1 Tax=Bacillus wiedmannii TaxID=1890302 RepID=A0A2A8BSJ6_9BACI|nr:hypothetical protein [Bacillus wiedmannii]PEM57632.1 hypothetical protein CN611_07425 [Bacillus wiedmannii]
MAQINIFTKNGKEIAIKADNLSKEESLSNLKEGLTTGKKFTTYESDEMVVGIVYDEISHFCIK